MKTQVAIIGAGPAGLCLARMLSLHGIHSIILERQTRAYVEARVRAGMLEQGMVELMRRAGVASRLDKEGLVHSGFKLIFDNQISHIDLASLTGGKQMVIYGQTELTKDLYDSVLADSNIQVFFGAQEVCPSGFLEEKPRVSFYYQNTAYTLSCDYLAGCDGYHGVTRAAIPKSCLREYERTYPFGWLGLLSDTPPLDEEAIYIHHQRGFALCSMRSRTRSRYYLQVPLSEQVSDWSDQDFWDELRRRLPASLADSLITGPSFEKSIAPLRSFVVEPLRFGSLFLVGDAGHIVPPTGAKGLNLAASDVHYLSTALIAWYQEGRSDLLDRYSATALHRIWAAVRFSWWFTSVTHKFSDDPIEQKIQLAELDYLLQSTAGQTTIAENYVGLDLAEDFV
ncbi:4-hydroxybenzoate 3-monooxygenase [Neisseriaceae bacterium TC5R-5]|nr:4-hydroxybenzoate 3-monooxygenase [Neisseriaceae bacterium TC5R-5]